MKRRFIESSRFPVSDVSLASAKEKSGGGRPPYWEMVFWWTRKPLASARAVIAGALLPENIDVYRFKSHLKLTNNICHKFNPTIPEDWKKYFEGKKLLDPFAGFGSIPLEGLRLGLDVTAVELLPVAYVFLKAVLEYPKKYGKKLVHDVEKWSKWIIEQLKNDPDIKELYEPDVAVYIGSWEIKCPHCHKWTPLIGNWWLARVKKESEESGGEGVSKGIFSRLAWMTYRPQGDRILIEIIDLNEKLKLKEIRATIKTKESKVIIGNRIFDVPKPNIVARSSSAICLHCGNIIKYIDVKTRRHYIETKKIPQYIKKNLKWYVKYAIKQYNMGNNEYARQRLLVKVKILNKNLKFEPVKDKDNNKLLEASEKLKRMKRDPDIPRESLPNYDKRSIMTYFWGNEKWFKLFNPRQLLTLVKLVKLIRETSRKVEEEKLREGWSREEAFKYAEAVTTYLAIALARYASCSNIATPWKNYTGFGSAMALLRAVSIMVFRGIAMTWNWTDYNIIYNNVGIERDMVSIVSSLLFLIPTISNSNNKIRVLLDDATILSKLQGKKFDIIVTDPPYYDDVPYTELSDFYFVWLKRCLSDIVEGRLAPRFIPEAFFEKIGARWVEVKTQWSESDIAMREVSLNLGRLSVSLEEGKKYFLNLLSRSFMVMSDKLVDNGVLVSYYAHTDPNAWEALLEAGWRAGKFKVTNAFPLVTESAQRVTARGKVALDTSIIVVWRKGLHDIGDADEIYREALQVASGRALELVRIGRLGADLFIGTMSSVLSLYTGFREVTSKCGKLSVGELVKEYVYPATAVAIARALGKLAGIKGFKVSGEVKSASGLFYLLCKVLFVRSPRAKRRVVDRSSFIMLVIGAKAYKEDLRKLKIVVKKDSRIHLMEPKGSDKYSVEDLLRDRGISITEPVLNNSVDALHLLEYYAISLPKETFKERLEWLRGEYPILVEEALIIAGILAEILPKGDPEKDLCAQILERGGLIREDQSLLTRFMS